MEKLEKKALTMGSVLASLIIGPMDMCLPRSHTERTHHLCSISVKMHHPNQIMRDSDKYILRNIPHNAFPLKMSESTNIMTNQGIVSDLRRLKRHNI